MIIEKQEFEAIKELTRLEAYACGKGTKDKYRLHFCKKAKEWTPQLKTGKTWLCLHN